MHRFCLRGLVLGSLVLALAGCRPPDDPLEAVKGFRPDDPLFKASMATLHFVTETQPVAQVDSLFIRTQARFQLPLDAKGCRDGIWEGRSPYDAYDYCHVVRLKILDEAIVAVDYDEVHRDGHGKESNAAYNQAMAASGSSPAEAYPHYEKAILDRQNLMDVDGVTGATYSLYRFRYAVTLALIKARLG